MIRLNQTYMELKSSKNTSTITGRYLHTALRVPCAFPRLHKYDSTNTYHSTQTCPTRHDYYKPQTGFQCPPVELYEAYLAMNSEQCVVCTKNGIEQSFCKWDGWGQVGHQAHISIDTHIYIYYSISVLDITCTYSSAQ